MNSDFSVLPSNPRKPYTSLALRLGAISLNSTMFFLHEMERVVNLHPSYFDKDTHSYITRTLYQDVEGTNTGNFYIVCVVSVIDISEPRVLPGSGFAEFTIMFQAVVWRPFKGEVCDGMVSSVVSNGFFVDVGPLNVFVSKAVSLIVCSVDRLVLTHVR